MILQGLTRPPPVCRFDEIEPLQPFILVGIVDLGFLSHISALPDCLNKGFQGGGGTVGEFSVGQLAYLTIVGACMGI